MMRTAGNEPINAVLMLTLTSRNPTQDMPPPVGAKLKACEISTYARTNRQSRNLRGYSSEGQLQYHPHVEKSPAKPCYPAKIGYFAYDTGRNTGTSLLKNNYYKILYNIKIWTRGLKRENKISTYDLILFYFIRFGFTIVDLTLPYLYSFNNVKLISFNNV